MKKYILLLLAFGFIITSCKKNDDAGVPDSEEQKVELQSEVNDFVWSAMNSWYYWQDEVIALGDNRFADQDDYYTFLNGFSDPESLFLSLNSPKDRFSWIVDNYNDIFNSLSGVFKTNGIEFALTRPPEGGNKVIGVVRYVIAGSDAAAKNINRGDIFYAVNGTELFAETDAEGTVISGNLNLLAPDTFTLNFAEISSDDMTVPNDVNIELTKTELTEDPILISKTLEVGGTKIGYFMYNQFSFGRDLELNEAFGVLKNEGITELILDLRYNLGGSGQTAQRLCSMLTGQFTGQFLSIDTFNDKWDDAFGSAELFVDEIDGTPINHLNLTKVYIIATDDSASASEYVINNLAPYIDVIHIGDVTRGKNQGSFTLVDNPDQMFSLNGETTKIPYLAVGGAEGSSVQNANPNHKYALQPIVSVYGNADGFSDFTDGLQPDFTLLESLGNLGQLGEPGEPLLDLAIEKITGLSGKSSNISVPNNLKIRTISSSTRLNKPYMGTLHKGFIGIK